MVRNPLVVVFDIEAAIKGVIEATETTTLSEFRADWLRRHAVQRGIEIISEAVRRLPPDILAAHTDIPWPKIRAVGNVLRHEYQNVSDEIIWSVVKNDLPRLQETMQKIRLDIERQRE